MVLAGDNTPFKPHTPPPRGGGPEPRFEPALNPAGGGRPASLSDRSEIHLKQDSKFVFSWQSLCFQHEQPRSLRTPPAAPCLSAADAFADTHRVHMGITGGMSTATHFGWCSEKGNP